MFQNYDLGSMLGIMKFWIVFILFEVFGVGWDQRSVFRVNDCSLVLFIKVWLGLREINGGGQSLQYLVLVLLFQVRRGIGEISYKNGSVVIDGKFSVFIFFRVFSIFGDQFWLYLINFFESYFLFGFLDLFCILFCVWMGYIYFKGFFGFLVLVCWLMGDIVRRLDS